MSLGLVYLVLISVINQGCHWSGKSGKFKVREKSGNFEKIQGNLEFWKKSGKFAIGQGNFEVLEDILPMRMTHCGLVLQEYDFCVICGIRCSGYFPNFIEMSCLTCVFV